jgi:hypothetical protein
MHATAACESVDDANNAAINSIMNILNLFIIFFPFFILGTTAKQSPSCPLAGRDRVAWQLVA